MLMALTRDSVQVQGEGEFALKLISPYWETERLFAREAVLDSDVDALQKLWESTAWVGEYDGHPERHEDDMYNDLTVGDLPPGGTLELFRVQPFFTKETSEMVGFIKAYHGYPDAMTVWVAFFCVQAIQQKQGFGHEIIKQFAIEATHNGYHRLRLVVALKNWGAIRFWLKAGFDTVTAVYGDQEYGTNTFAHLGLVKSLV